MDEVKDDTTDPTRASTPLPKPKDITDEEFQLDKYAVVEDPDYHNYFHAAVEPDAPRPPMVIPGYVIVPLNLEKKIAAGEHRTSTNLTRTPALTLITIYITSPHPHSRIPSHIFCS